MELLISLMIIVIGILVVFIKWKIPKKEVYIKENSLGYTKEEVLDKELKGRQDIRSGDSVIEGYDYKMKKITIKNKESKELGEILKVIDFLASTYNNNYKFELLIINVVQYTAAIMFILYYMLILSENLTLFFVSFLLIILSIVIRYFMYMKNISIRKNIILKKYNFTEEENKRLLKGGREIEKILNILKLIIFVLIMVLFYNYLLL